jgi:hypothetical protein
VSEEGKFMTGFESFNFGKLNNYQLFFNVLLLLQQLSAFATASFFSAIEMRKKVIKVMVASSSSSLTGNIHTKKDRIMDLWIINISVSCFPPYTLCSGHAFKSDSKKNLCDDVVRS